MKLLRLQVSARHFTAAFPAAGMIALAALYLFGCASEQTIATKAAAGAASGAATSVQTQLNTTGSVDSQETGIAAANGALSAALGSTAPVATAPAPPPQTNP